MQRNLTAGSGYTQNISKHGLVDLVRTSVNSQEDTKKILWSAECPWMRWLKFREHMDGINHLLKVFGKWCCFFVSVELSWSARKHARTCQVWLTESKGIFGLLFQDSHIICVSWGSCSSNDLIGEVSVEKTKLIDAVRHGEIKKGWKGLFFRRPHQAWEKIVDIQVRLCVKQALVALLKATQVASPFQIRCFGAWAIVINLFSCAKMMIPDCENHHFLGRQLSQCAVSCSSTLDSNRQISWPVLAGCLSHALAMRTSPSWVLDTSFRWLLPRGGSMLRNIPMPRSSLSESATLLTHFLLPSPLPWLHTRAAWAPRKHTRATIPRAKAHWRLRLPKLCTLASAYPRMRSLSAMAASAILEGFT